MQTVVIGCGRWGSFIAWYLNRIGHSVTLYGRSTSAGMKALMDTRKNEYIVLPDTIALSTDLTVTQKAETIFISISSQNLADLAAELKQTGCSGKNIVLCMKGIEIGSCRRLSQIMKEALGAENKIAVWLGPGHVQDFLKGIPNCMVIDSEDAELKAYLVKNLSSDLIRFYYGNDLIGNEVGAAAKNVYGIAAGMLDALDLASLKGPLIARAPRELSELIQKMGGDRMSAYGLCHLGDYQATIFSEHSHNRKFGEMFVQGKKFEKLAEGYYTVQSLCELGRRYQVNLPIADAVYDVLYKQKDPETVVKRLFERALKNEF